MRTPATNYAIPSTERNTSQTRFVLERKILKVDLPDNRITRVKKGLMNQLICFGDFLEFLLPSAGYYIHHYALVPFQRRQSCKPESGTMRPLYKFKLYAIRWIMSISIRKTWYIKERDSLKSVIESVGLCTNRCSLNQTLRRLVHLPINLL